MAVEEDGVWFVATMWLMASIVSILVVLRVYSRVVLVSCFGWDDIAYLIAYLFFISVCIVMTASSYYGFGQTYIENQDHRAIARFCEGIAVILVATGMVIGKFSLGLFLLRIVQEFWQKVAIWGINFLLGTASVICSVSYWTQCRPVAFIWDKRLDGNCNNLFVPMAYSVTSICVFADLFFATFPWLFLWKLQMNRKDKIIILTSMSLGLIAGIFGIKRTTDVGSLNHNSNFLKDTVSVAIWSVAEIAVTLICVGIPVCLPFFRKVHRKWATTNFVSAINNTDGEIPLHQTEGGKMFNATRKSEIACHEV